MNAKADAKSGDQLLPAIRDLQQTLKRQWMLIPLLLLPGIIALFIASKWLPSIRSNAAANPLIEIAEHVEAVDAKARELASQQVKMKTRMTVLPLKPLREWQDPRIKIVKFLIDQEQEQQTFMLHMLRGLRDLGELMKGIDEWSYFKYTQVRRLIERSRNRQQDLRTLLVELEEEQKASRELIDRR
jgi:hypothetical protein